MYLFKATQDRFRASLWLVLFGLLTLCPSARRGCAQFADTPQNQNQNLEAGQTLTLPTYLEPLNPPLPATQPMQGNWPAQGQPEASAYTGGNAYTGVTPYTGVTAPWWSDAVPVPFRGSPRTLSIELDMLFALTAAHSGHVQAISQTPWINQMQVEQARAAFDPTLFSDARFDSTSDPVGNTLTTGGPPRLQDSILAMDAGLRGQNQNGTNYSLGQKLGHKNSNSNFFAPNDQGTARLSATLNKPLLRGRKTDVNRTLVLTAEFQTATARAEYEAALQKQLFQVADTYWSLYVERASLLQRQRHLVRAKEIADLITSRETLDSSNSQILRARAAVANRTAELAQADTRIRNLEARLRALVNAPELVDDRNTEFLPTQAALIQPIEFDIESEVTTALQRRPELADLQSKLDTVNARLNLAKDQTKATLNLVTEGYLAGLQGRSDIAGAWNNQFTDGRPGGAFGLVYELPVRRRAATAAVRQRQYETAQLEHLVREMRENIRAEVESATRDVYAQAQSAIGRQLSLEAVEAEVASLQDRWKTLGNDPRLGQLQLSELLGAQDRLLQEEQNLLQALVQYNRSLLEVQRSTGKLIQFARDRAE